MQAGLFLKPQYGECLMRRLHKPIQQKVRPGISRVRRTQVQSRLRTIDKLHRGETPPDLSSLILYGQG